MGRCIVRLERNGVERFLEWSTVVDAPVTRGMTEAQLREWVGHRYGTQAVEALPQRIARARHHGTSFVDPVMSLASLIGANRAGPGETHLTEAELWDQWVEGNPS